MKRNIVWTLFFVAMLSLSLAAVGKDKKDNKDNDEIAGYTCSPAKVAGTWGYSETGTLILYSSNAPNASVVGTMPYASVGRYTIDAAGNFSGWRNASQGGTVLHATIDGTVTVNPDCTGIETLFFTDDNGNRTGPATKFIVFVNNARDVHKIITSTPVPYYQGMFLGMVLTTEANKLSPGHGEEDAR